MSPAASTTMSPGTRSRSGSSISLPPRTSVQVALIIDSRLSTARLERRSCTYPSRTLSTTITATTDAARTAPYTRLHRGPCIASPWCWCSHQPRTFVLPGPAAPHVELQHRATSRRLQDGVWAVRPLVSTGIYRARVGYKAKASQELFEAMQSYLR